MDEEAHIACLVQESNLITQIQFSRNALRMASPAMQGFWERQLADDKQRLRDLQSHRTKQQKLGPP